MRRYPQISNASNGFTLIEVLIAIAIFSFIAIGTSSAVIRGLTVKKRVEKEWQEIHSLRTALTVLTRDLSLAFHKPRSPQSLGFGLSDREKWFKTYFKSKSNDLDFTSLSNRRLYENTHESELCEIGYRLQEKNLVRRISVYVDDEPTQGGKLQILLENVEAFSLRFYSKEKDRWHEEWDTEHSDFRDKFPDAVQVILKWMIQDKPTEISTKIIVSNPKNMPGTSP